MTREEWGEAKMWIRRIWAHWKEARVNPKAYRTKWWDCFKATLAILLNRYVDDPSANYSGWEEVAWGDYHSYGEYGIGNGWTALAVKGIRYTTYSDGDY